MAVDEVERAIRQRQGLGGADERGALEPEPRGVGPQRGEHAGGDVNAYGAFNDPREHQIEREIAGPSPDLERALERVAGARRAERLVELAHDLFASRAAEG